MKKTNKKGFTLVEVLVAITIMGIILAIAIPRVINIQSDNQQTKYIKYGESLVDSAKLYTDSYNKDMFGNNTSGCYDIPYSSLEAKNLAKDIKVDGSTCNVYAADHVTSLTYVRVYKTNDNYYYDLAIVCNDKNGKEVYKQALTSDICNGTTTDTDGPTISISGNDNWTTGKDSSGNPLKVTVTIADPYGLKENVKVEYAWTKTPDNITGLTFTEKAFTNSRTDLVRELTFKVDYPQNENGEWYLVVRPVGGDLRDANGNYYTGGYAKSGAFKLDNTPPTVDATTNSSNGAYTGNSATITATASDTLSGVKKIYYTFNSDGKTSLKTDWSNTFTSGSRGPITVTKEFTTELDTNVYIVVEDVVGNKSTVKDAGKVVIDTTPPTCVSSGGSSAWTNQNVTLTGTCSDSGSGCKSNVTKDYENDINSTTESPGTVYDNAGNSVVCPADQTVKIDKTKPEVTSIENPSNGNATVPGLVLTLNGTDSGGSGIAKWRYTYDTTKGWTDYASSNKSPFTTTPFTTIRNQDVYISLCDNAGNCSDTDSTRIHIVDACGTGYTEVSSTGSWGSCSKQCDTGTQSRTVYYKSKLDGRDCGSKTETQNCNERLCCSSTKTSCGSWGTCEGTCGTGTQYKTCTLVSTYDSSVSCGAAPSESQSCDTGKLCEAPAHSHSTGVLGTTLKKCNWTLSCGTYHPQGYYGYCGYCWNYGIRYRSTTSKYCPGRYLDGCKWYNTSYPTVVPDADV